MQRVASMVLAFVALRLSGCHDASHRYWLEQKMAELQALGEQGDDWVRGVVYDGLTQAALGGGSQRGPFQVWLVHRDGSGERVVGRARYYQEGLFAVRVNARDTGGPVALRFDGNGYAPCEIPVTILPGGPVLVPLFPARAVSVRVRLSDGEAPKDLRVLAYDRLGRLVPQYAIEMTDPCLLADDGTTVLFLPVGEVVLVLLDARRVVATRTAFIEAGVDREQVCEVVIGGRGRWRE